MVGLIELNGTALYAYVVPQGDVVKVRVSADDWERLWLSSGQRVRLDVPGRTASPLLLATVDQEPPVVWLRLVPLEVRRAS
jgi:hypothetical protein